MTVGEDHDSGARQGPPPVPAGLAPAPVKATAKGPPPLPPELGEALAPVNAAERNPSLDVLRGMALLGILIVNMIYFNEPLDQMGLREGLHQSSADMIAEFFSVVLVEGKFYTLFSFLFGMGFVIQMDRAKARGKDAGKVFCRRLLILMGFGLAHGLFLWDGDVLFLYGLCGFGLLAFRNCKAKTLMVWACVLIALQTALIGLIGIAIWLLQSLPEFSGEITEALADDPMLHAELKAAYVTGTYWDAVAHRAIYWLETTLTLLVMSTTFFAMFLVGMHPMAKAALNDPDSNRALLRKIVLYCGGVGLAISCLSAAIFMAGSASGNIGMVITHAAMVSLGGPLLTLAYVSLYLLCSKRLLHHPVVLAVGKAGRMALTNYLLQSLIATSLFYGYGLGWAGSMGRAETLVVAAGIFGLQVLLSHVWLGNFRFGPMEWLWRSLTYGRRQAMRIPD